MKKLIFIFIIILSVSGIKAQAVLEHTYPLLVYQIFYTDAYGFVYAYGDSANFEKSSNIIIASDDHQEIKTIPVTEPGYFLSNIWNVSDHLFNTDDKIEVLYSVTPDITGLDSKAIVKNEDGSTVQTFDKFGICCTETYPSIYEMNGKFKLRMHYTEAGIIKSQVYALPGTTKLAVPKDLTGYETSAFPNPSNTAITFGFHEGSSEMVIYNTSGTEVSRYNIHGKRTEKVSTSDFLPGNYLYRISGERPATGKFTIMH